MKTEIVEKKEMAIQSQHQAEAWSPKEVMNQVQAIQELMKQGMTDGEHYGVIPGTNGKPTLLKAGAEKLCLMFRLAPAFDIKFTDLGNGHREIQVICTLTHIKTKDVWGQGLGSCSTMEKKYRYRTGDGESTGVVVPKEYWDLKRIGKFKEAQERIGVGYGTKKIDGTWFVVEKVEGQENPNIADTYNTVLKIAKKRALVDATLTATAASDCFTQDLEELLPETEEKKPESKPDLPPKPVEVVISHDEQLELFRLIKEKNVAQKAFQAYLKEDLGIAGTNKITPEQYPKVVEWIIRSAK